MHVSMGVKHGLIKHQHLSKAEDANRPLWDGHWKSQRMDIMGRVRRDFDVGF